MNFFNRIFGSKVAQNQPLDTSVNVVEQLSYDDCKKIFAYHPLGKRLVKSIIKFSLSSPRKIVIQDVPDEVVTQFEKTLKEYEIDKIVKRLATINRIYGMAGLFVATNDDNLEDFDTEKVLSNKLYFNVLDPYNFKVSVMQNDATKPNFMRPTNIRVGNKEVGGRRAYVCVNGDPLFIEFTPSALNFAGRSVFANMSSLLAQWDSLYDSLDKIATKAGATLITNEHNASTAQDLEVANASARLIKDMRQGGVAFLNGGQHAEFFNLNGATEIASMITELKNALAMALDDTPSAILLDKELSNGLSEGSEDMKAVVMAVNEFRSDYLNPIYEFLDSFMFYKAWSDDFINDFLKQGDNSQKYLGLSLFQIRQLWIDNYSFIWESVYPKTPDEETKEKDKVLERLVIAKELGGDIQSIQANLNDSKVFPNEITLEVPEPIFNDNFEDFNG